MSTKDGECSGRLKGVVTDEKILKNPQNDFEGP
ncbi:hypothetical protein GWI33_014437, partial [Rhynchophorus ferrugineus]